MVAHTTMMAGAVPCLCVRGARGLVGWGWCFFVDSRAVPLLAIQMSRGWRGALFCPGVCLCMLVRHSKRSERSTAADQWPFRFTLCVVVRSRPRIVVQCFRFFCCFWLFGFLVCTARGPHSGAGRAVPYDPCPSMFPVQVPVLPILQRPGGGGRPGLCLPSLAMSSSLAAVSPPVLFNAHLYVLLLSAGCVMYRHLYLGSCLIP